MDTLIVNTASSYNTTTGNWTAPYTGSYLFICSVSFNDLNSTDNHYGSIEIHQAGSSSRNQIISYVPYGQLKSADMQVQGSIILPCAVGDNISFSAFVYGSGSTNNVGINGGFEQGTYLSITKVY